MVSVLLPAYKSSYLKDAIESVINQTYRDWELIIVNDKSPHPIEDIVVNYLTDPRVHYYINEENIGKKDLVANWNKCLSYAQGEYFALICDDDLYKPTFLEEMVLLAKKYNSCDVFRAGVEVINSEKKITDYYPTSPEWESCEDYMWHVFRGYRCQTITEWFYRTDTIRKLGGFYSLPLAWYSDFLSIFIFSQNNGIASNPKHLVCFRMSGENITSQKELYADRKMEASLIFEHKVKDIIKRNSIVNKEMIDALLKKYLRQKRTFTLTTCKWHDLIKIIRNHKRYTIDKKMIIKSIIARFII